MIASILGLLVIKKKEKIAKAQQLLALKQDQKPTKKDLREQ